MTRKNTLFWQNVKKNKHCYLWLLPFFILFIFLYLYPTLYGFYISFTNYDGFITKDFVGLDNYIKAFNDAKMYQTLFNSVVLWALIVPIRTIGALLMAAILNSKKLLGGKVLKVVVLIPYITSVAVLALVFRILLSTETGLVNVFLQNVFSIEPIGWLDTAQFSKVSVAMMNIFRMTGYFSLVMLAGMQKIPVAVNEAATIDGAGPIRQFFNITLPLMVQELFFVSLISTIWIFQNITDAMVLTSGGPLMSSTTLVYYSYLNGFSYGKMGYSAALNFILFFLLFFFTVLQSRQHYKKTED